MTTQDILMLVASFLYVGLVVLGSQTLNKKGYSLLMTRKLVHVLIGLWIIPAMLGFDHVWVAAIPPFIALIGNTVSHFTGMIGSIELVEEKPNYGTILYPGAFLLTVLIFFPAYSSYWYAGMLGILIMTFSDTAAGLYGRKYGRSKYEIADETKSIEGSMAMFFVTLLLALIVFWVWDTTGFSIVGNLVLSLYVAFVATILEAVSIRGWDNFVVPMGTALFIVVMMKVL